jgi:hypothetical protein
METLSPQGKGFHWTYEFQNKANLRHFDTFVFSTIYHVCKLLERKIRGVRNFLAAFAVPPVRLVAFIRYPTQL